MALDLRSADEARALLAAFPAVGVERVALPDLDGRVTAADLLVPEDLPRWPRAIMDGYAVRAADTPGSLRVVGTVPMGDVYPGAVGHGEAVAIATGGVLPDGADAVVMIEQTRSDGAGLLEVGRAVAAAEHVMRPGDDLRRGEILVARGWRLRAQDTGALAALGVTELEVHRRPRVGLLATGHELVDPGDPTRPGQVRDANSTALAAQARRAGCDVVAGGIVPDDGALLAARARELLAACDAVLLSGGSSIGPRDLTARVLVDAGAEIVFHGIDVRPGKPTILARAGDKPVLGIPGVPATAQVIFAMFVRPLLARLGGEHGLHPWPARRRARLAGRAPSVAGREDYLRVKLVLRDGEPWAEVVPGGNSALSTLVRADGLVVVPAASTGLAEGDQVEVLLHS